MVTHPPDGWQDSYRPRTEKPVAARDAQTRQAFIAYLEAHPQYRFWQAVRNFSGYAYLIGIDADGKQEDTFFIEADAKKELSS